MQRGLFPPSLISFLTELWGGFTSIKKRPPLNWSVMWRSSKWHWMLQFYIVWQRCLLDMPYHKYHLLLVSGLSGPVRSWLKFISKELRGGLSFTVEAWQQQQQQGAVRELSQSRPGKITPKFQWHNGQNQSSSQQSFSLPRGMRDAGPVQERGATLLRDRVCSLISQSVWWKNMTDFWQPVDSTESCDEGVFRI